MTVVPLLLALALVDAAPSVVASLPGGEKVVWRHPVGLG